MSATVESTWRQRISNAIEIPLLTRCCFCVPLRRGLITFAYINLAQSLLAIYGVANIIALLKAGGAAVGLEGLEGDGAIAIRDELNSSMISRLIADTTALVLELLMTILFIFALHKKHVTLMRIYLYFEIVFSAVGFVYSISFMTHETAYELFVILFQLNLQMYLAILIWSSIKKMERDGTVKYTREVEPPA